MSTSKSYEYLLTWENAEIDELTLMTVVAINQADADGKIVEVVNQMAIEHPLLSIKPLGNSLI